MPDHVSSKGGVGILHVDLSPPNHSSPTESIEAYNLTACGNLVCHGCAHGSVMQISHQYHAQHATKCIVQTSCRTLHAVCHRSDALCAAFLDTKQSAVPSSLFPYPSMRKEIEPCSASQAPSDEPGKKLVAVGGRHHRRSQILEVSSARTSNLIPRDGRRLNQKKASGTSTSQNRGRAVHKAWRHAASIRSRSQPQAKSSGHRESLRSA